MPFLTSDNLYAKRAAFLRDAAKRDKELLMPGDVTVEHNVPYMDDSLEAHYMDIYRPKGSENKILPVIINIHGGGLIMGNKEFNRFFCAKLCKHGYLVFSIEYRLIPDCLVFDQFSDVCNAFNYIQAHLDEYNGDADHIYGVADSGGAYLLTYTAAMHKCHALANAAHVEPHNVSFRALGLISGMFYTTRFDKIGIFLPDFFYGNNYVTEPFAKYINPENPEIIDALPPCFIVTSRHDNLRKYSLYFASTLEHHNKKYKYSYYPTGRRLTHAFSVFRPDLKESEETIFHIHAFFESYK